MDPTARWLFEGFDRALLAEIAPKRCLTDAPSWHDVAKLIDFTASGGGFMHDLCASVAVSYRFMNLSDE